MEILSIWRSALDQVALLEADSFCRRQPRCSISGDEDFSAMTIFNYAYYIAGASGDPNAGLADMFLAMAPGPYATGGTAFIPQTTLISSLSASSVGFMVPDQCNMVGSGGGGPWTGMGNNPYYHFVIDFSNGTRFLNCAGNYTSGGKYFRSLAFKGTNWGGSEDTCILAATDSCRAVNCTFADVPTAFDAQGDGCMLEQCTINYAGPINDASAIIVAGAQCGVYGPADIDQHPQNMGGPTGCNAISIRGAEHTVIANVHLSDWNIGVDFSAVAGAQDTELRTCEIQSFQSALNITLPEMVSGITAGIKVMSCTLAKSTNSDATDPVVNIDPLLDSGNENSQLADITLLDCTVFNFALSNTAAQHGLSIAGGTNIKIIGGTYSNNSSEGGAGIAITGACGDVQIIGANLQPSYPWAATMPASLNYQQYGLLVTAAPSGTVYVSGCDMTGYTGTGQQAVNVAVPIDQGLYINDCPGYNDAPTPTLNRGIPPTSPLNAATCSTPYFGPSVFIFSNATPVSLTVFGQTFSMSFGIIFLPSPYDKFNFGAHVPPTMMFAWIGR
jgi:hypothetical protein